MKNEKDEAPYVVIIDGRDKSYVHTEEEAWDIISKAHFGALHEVHDEKGNIRPEFVPF